MSESFKEASYTSSTSSYQADLELDFDLDTFGHDLGNDLEMGGAESPSNPNLYPLAVPVRTLTNAPGCAPSNAIPKQTASSASSESSSSFTASTASTSSTPSPPAPTTLRKVRSARRARTDAWAVPSSANWGRSRRPMRSVKRVSRSTDWALPF